MMETETCFVFSGAFVELCWGCSSPSEVVRIMGSKLGMETYLKGQVVLLDSVCVELLTHFVSVTPFFH